MPDAKEYGDDGANTLKTISKSSEFNIPLLKKMGLFNIDGLDYIEEEKNPIACFGKSKEASKGKDTTTGHWEMSGIILNNPFPTYPNGFPKEILDEFSAKTGRGVLCNKPYSGTEVIKDYGKEHIKTGNLIVYTSADSVFQIAAHEDHVPIEELYKYCEIAREILQGEHNVGRVIARPFKGNEQEGFYRTENRHDFSAIPPKDSALVKLKNNGNDVIAIGKINDIFAGIGVTDKYHTKNNSEGMEKTFEMLSKDFTGLCFTNLVDFDMVYGHRRNIDGYAKALTDYNNWLEKFIQNMQDDDLLIITADHGCDPGFKGTDHTREYIPILVYSKNIKPTNLEIRQTYADIAKTILENFKANNEGIEGTSFLKEITNKYIGDHLYDKRRTN